MNTHTHTCSPKSCLSVKLVMLVVEFRSIFLALSTFELLISCRLRDVDLQYSTDECASARYRGLTGHNRSVDLSRACKLQHSKYMSTCVSDDQSRRRENETTAALKGGREAVSTDPSIETVLVCLFFHLALKINARGGRETEKLISVP